MIEKDIKIDAQAMETCYYACEQELFTVLESKHIPMKETLLRFMKMELRDYVRIALLGLIITLASCVVLPDASMIIVTIYFMMLASYAVFESYKTKVYHMSELLMPVYLNPVRVFLLKSVAIAICQLSLFFILIFMIAMLQENIGFDIILYSLLPVYVYQTLLLVFLPKIHNMMSALILYMGMAGVHIGCIQLFDLDVWIGKHMIGGCFILVLFVYACICIIKLNTIYKRGGYCHESTDETSFKAF